jgi:hypothetical protein
MRGPIGTGQSCFAAGFRRLCALMHVVNGHTYHCMHYLRLFSHGQNCPPGRLLPPWRLSCQSSRLVPSAAPHVYPADGVMSRRRILYQAARRPLCNSISQAFFTVFSQSRRGYSEPGSHQLSSLCAQEPRLQVSPRNPQRHSHGGPPRSSQQAHVEHELLRRCEEGSPRQRASLEAGRGEHAGT